MKVAHLKRLPMLLVSACLVVGWASTAFADTNYAPYFKTYGGDVMAGGWFDSGTNCDTSQSGNYQDSAFSNASLGLPQDSRTGGILAYANQDGSGVNSAGGASSQYGAFALGQIDSADPVDHNGFYSAGSLAAVNPTAKNLISFANNTGGWGGIFELGTSGGGVRQGSCIPDYYSKLSQATPTIEGTSTPFNSYNSSGTYSVTVPNGSVYNLTNANLSLASSPSPTKVTLYVSGNVYIGNNITYNLDSATDVPKFALVVKGSIYIGPGVTELDGFYIAQPNSTTASAITADDGDIWTCHDNTSNPINYNFPTSMPQCTVNKLVINGALVAKQVNFTRLNGNVLSATSAEDSLSGGMSSNNIGEVINYTPAMIIGGGFFSTSGSNASTALPIDNLLSLPPAF
ncbi:MAG TPA: hypothetical protein VMT23_00040 [Candidatus Binatia bacterium]|nr:hypothetical protein [Candidatus Binatia bacterium]